MNTPIVLKAADVIAAARKAYEEKRLSAQHGPTIMCRYLDPEGYPCAVGAAIPADVTTSGWWADGRYNTQRIARLVENGVVKIEPARGIAELTDLQNAHDDWAGTIGSCHEKVTHERFRALIGLDPLPVEG